MPRPRYENVEPERKTKLLDAAMKEFGAHGYELASINRILEASGFSKGSFYYYFDDKLDLAAATFIAAAQPTLHLGEFGEQLCKPATPDDFWGVLQRISHLRLKMMVSRRAEYECVIRLSNAFAAHPELAAKVLPLFDPGRKAMNGFLEQGVAVGALRSDLPLPVVMALIEAVKLAAYKSMFPGDRVPDEAEMESFTALVIDLAKRIAAPSTR